MTSSFLNGKTTSLDTERQVLIIRFVSSTQGSSTSTSTKYNESTKYFWQR